MFENCLRFVTDQPITVHELETLARTGTNLDGMRRWGYLTIDGTAQKIHQGRPGPGAVLRATARGLRARETWLPLPALIEERWRERFGAEPIAQLRRSLEAIAARLDPGLPDCLPILGQVLFSRGPDPALPPRPEPPDVATLPLSALLSRVLLAFALEYEAESATSLAVGANLLRVLRADGTRLRDLPPQTGISKEAMAWARGVLLRARLAVEEPDPAANRGQVARLTPAGLRRPAPLPRAPGDGGRALDAALRQRHDRRLAPAPGSTGHRRRGPAAAPVPGPGALPGQLAGIGPPAPHAPALPDGPAPRWLPRRQLSARALGHAVHAVLALGPAPTARELTMPGYTA